MNGRHLAVILLYCFLESSCGFKLATYLEPHENTPVVFNCSFVKPKDNTYRNVESIFGKIGNRDTILEKVIIEFKTMRIDGKTAYYAIDDQDTNRKDPSIGPKHFLSSAMIFTGDSILLASIYKKSDLLSLTLNNFKNIIPSKVKKYDTLIIEDKNQPSKQLILHQFKKEKIIISNEKLNCLAFLLTEKWPNSKSDGKIWIHKKYGVVKWIRSTGRIEEREF